ncbi:sensor histidine kinase [Bradyrhizobium lablabi]|uniref:sensor histidine kinase n=1 Tax=Bradyrhizobium lablabi TaxID=722472 RepID=UPI001BAC0BD4|nr:sensor histidine kinase [Bradyrhizobium lablabi]MBR0697366.1 sensor histidine kinase [Bradyrhizobium lablabi]
MRQSFNGFQNGATILSDDISVSGCDEPLDLLVKEFRHRILNLLSVVQCLVNNTQGGTADDYRVALTERIAILSDAHGVIERAQEGISIERLLERTLKPHAAFSRDRILLAGPNIILQPRLALALNMIFYELATNACKHGALMSASGVVEVFWDLLPAADSEVLAVQWRERGGPLVREPKRQGFGLRMLSKAIPAAKVSMEFDPAGIVCRLLVMVDRSTARRRNFS